jgi:hypothetical protein
MFVIPGRDEGASPESITTIVSMDSGLAPSGAPRKDGGEAKKPAGIGDGRLLSDMQQSSAAVTPRNAYRT